MTSPPPLRADQLRRIEQSVIADLKPVEQLARPEVYLVGVAGVFAAVCALGAYLGAPRGWDALGGVQRIAVFSLLVAAAAALIFSIVRLMSPLAMHARSGIWIGAGIFGALLSVFGVLFQPASEHAFARNGLLCLRLGMLFAVPAGILFALLLKRGAWLSPTLTGATAGALAGLVGLTVLEIDCPNLNVYHIVVWHVSVTVVCIILGFIFSSVTFSRWRSNP